jgi:hypothetical protein
MQGILSAPRAPSEADLSEDTLPSKSHSSSAGFDLGDLPDAEFRSVAVTMPPRCLGTAFAILVVGVRLVMPAQDLRLIEVGITSDRVTLYPSEQLVSTLESIVFCAGTLARGRGGKRHSPSDEEDMT